LNLFTVSSESPIPKTQRYSVGKELKNQDILLWPNFISKKWCKYFMYSELPHNDEKYRATPFVGDTEDPYFRIVTDDKKVPVYLSENGKIKPILDSFLKDKIISSCRTNTFAAGELCGLRLCSDKAGSPPALYLLIHLRKVGRDIPHLQQTIPASCNF
jgi:hypothetical protein